MISDHHPKLHYYSFKHAWRGITTAISSQRNLRLEIMIGFAAIILAIFLEFTAAKLMIVAATILLVLGFEMINTSVESMVDSVHVEHNELAKVSKDASAAAVLIATILAIIVGIYLYLPPILMLVS
jgi:diacylglycerol kinase (ATP)